MVRSQFWNSDVSLSVLSCSGVSQLYPLASTSLWTQAIPEKGLDLQQGNFLQPREISGEG